MIIDLRSRPEPKVYVIDTSSAAVDTNTFSNSKSWIWYSDPNTLEVWPKWGWDNSGWTWTQY